MLKFSNLIKVKSHTTSKKTVMYFDYMYFRYIVFCNLLVVVMYTSVRVIIERVHPIGQTIYRNVRFCTSGNMRYTQINLSPHINTRVANVGMSGFPSPRRAEQRISLIPQMKYVLDMIIIFCCE